MFFQLSPRERAGYAALVVILLAIAGVVGFRSGNNSPRSPAINERYYGGDTAGHSKNHRQTPPESQSTADREVVVHVVGAVRISGVYHLPPDSRVTDALKAAGGPTASADLEAIDLAARLEDGEQVRVPLKGAASASAGPALQPAGPSVGGKKGKISGGTISLNSAALEDLETLPGVGPATAQRILDWRKSNGSFTDVDQLRQVSGIGDKKLAKIRPYVRL